MLDFIFRTDASVDIGTGHVMRCLTVAEMLRDRGSVCQFVCRNLYGNLNDLIQSRGFEVHVLPASNEGIAVRTRDDVPHARWLSVGWAQDAQETLSALSRMAQSGRTDWMVVDHYALDKRWELAVRGAYRRLLVIDDLADRTHHCDILIDQNIGRQDADYELLVNPDCDRLTGTEYALLRPEFAEFRAASLARRADSSIGKLLISLGGIDKDNATAVVLDGLAHCDLPADLEIVVVMGEQAPWLSQVRAKAQRMRWKTFVATNVTNMAALMVDADIAIGAAGSTTWERCCLGLPSLVLGTAENQRYVLSQLVARDIAVVGAMDALTREPAGLALHVQLLLKDVQGYSRRAAALVDGNGCDMLAELLIVG